MGPDVLLTVRGRKSGMPRTTPVTICENSGRRGLISPFGEDIHAIDAMGSTLPYYDIVLTDKAVASHIKRTKLAERLDTIVLWRLSDLLQHL